MDRRQRLLIIVPLSLALLIAVVYFLVVPGYRQYRGMKNQLEQLQAKVANARIVTNSLKGEKAQHDQAKLDLERFSKLFETEMRDGSNVILLGLKAATAKIKIVSIIPGEIIEKPNYLEMPLDITAEGNYPNMLAFCANIERLPNLTDIRILKILSAPSGDSASNVTVNIGIIIFSAKTPQEKLALEEIRKWAVGRSNLFQPASGVVSVPGASPYQATPPKPLNAAGLVDKRS